MDLVGAKMEPTKSAIYGFTGEDINLKGVIVGLLINIIIITQHKGILKFYNNQQDH